MQYRAARGTEDLLPGRMLYWNAMQMAATEIFGRHGYSMIETPIFEQTDIFIHGIGQSTDVVSKEMFTVLSPDAYTKVATGNAERLKNDQRLTLRPEGTASFVRAAQQHNLLPQGGAPVKAFYAGPMFRAERQQRGRLRQFHQIGVECLGAADPFADAEAIIMLMQYLFELGIDPQSVKLLINSMGDDACRPHYREQVRAYIHEHSDELCEECNRRADINPLRAFDCKNETCQHVMKGAPNITDYLCDDCKTHYEQVKKYLDIAGIEYHEDSRLVRGLDYYTRTVFEVQVISGLGAQNALGGGGRYDKLVEIMGGKPTPGLGFAVGAERIMLALEDQGFDLTQTIPPELFMAFTSPQTKAVAYELTLMLRLNGIRVETDYQDRSLKSQLKLAGKLGVEYVVIVGDDELAADQVTVRDMKESTEETVVISDLLDYFMPLDTYEEFFDEA